MPETPINRLQTPLRQQFLKALSKNFRPVAYPNQPGAPGTGGVVGTPAQPAARADRVS